MATETAIHFAPARIDRLSAEDFETASIRSAAPSYISDAPSYHSAQHANEPCPTYSPRTVTTGTPASADESSNQSLPRQSSMLPPVPMTSNFTPGAGLPRIGLPRIPPPRRGADGPSIADFRPPSSWSTLHSNPTARHYQSVANRRAAAASSSATSSYVEGALRTGKSRINAVNAAAGEDTYKVRPLEDPYLVGEEAAARARRERLARENGDDILIREDRRWDWFFAQMNDWDERESSWTAFRSNIDRRRFGHRFAR